MRKKIFFIILLFGLFLIPKNAMALEDGTYVISTINKGKYVLDLTYGKTTSGTNIQLYELNNTPAQEWNITKLENGYYRIESAKDKTMVLDVKGANGTNGTNVQLYQSNNTVAQQWLIKENGGYYNIISKINNMYLDIKGGLFGNGSNIQIYAGNGTAAQTFNLEKKEDKFSVKNGDYEIISAKDENFALDLQGANYSNKANIQMYLLNHTNAQVWNLVKLPNGFYVIKSFVDNNKVLDVLGGAGINGQNVQLYDYNESIAQQWYLKEVESGIYNIVSRINNKYLNIKNGTLYNSTNIEVNEKNNSDSQKFKIKLFDEKVDVDDGIYTISNFKDNNFVIDLMYGGIVNGTNIQLYSSNKTASQQWKVTNLNNGYYKIESTKTTDMVLDVSGGKSVNGTNIQLYKSNGTAAQQWYFTKDVYGRISIVSRLDNKYLDIKYGNLNNSSNIQIYQKNNANSQKFNLEKIEAEVVPSEPEESVKYAPIKNNNTSNFTNAVIFVKFSDDEKDIFNTTYTSTYSRNNFAEIKKMYNEKYSVSGANQSFKNYISEVTNNKVNVNNVFIQQTYDEKKVVTFTLKNPKSYYNDGDTIVSEVINAIKDGTINNNFGDLKFDNLEDGVIDCLTLIVQGKADDRSDLLTSHKTVYSGSNLISGKYVRNYILLGSDALVEEDGSISAGQQQGVISHEFLHVLGLPDLYRNTGAGMPVGPWDIMAQTSTFLQYPLGYLRVREGWITSKEITKSGTYTIDSVSSSGQNQVFVLKTPLNDSEYIVLEYRKKSSDMGATENKIPSSGLLMYRVDTKVDNLSNFVGNNYIYVYRPGVTDKDSSTDLLDNGMNAVYNAALDPDANRTSYGTTNLTDSFTNNTLYYSDGSNSGIKISNVKYSSDLSQMTFDLEFADYNTEDLWTTLGTVSSDVKDKNYLYNDDVDNSLYSAYGDYNNKVYVKKYSNGVWTQVGNELINLESPKVISFKNSLYLIGRDINNYHAITYIYKEGWQQLNDISTDYAQDYNFIKDENNLYLYYYFGNELYIYNALTKELITKKIVTSTYSNPSLELFNNKIYLTYSDFEGTSKNGIIDSYNLLTNIWNNEKKTDLINSNVHVIKKVGTKLYSLIGLSGKNPILFIYDGSSWTEKVITSMSNYLDVSMNILNNDIYITYTNKDETSTIKISGNNEVVYDKNIGTGLENVYAVSSTTNNTIYITASTKNSTTFTVKKKIVK